MDQDSVGGKVECAIIGLKPGLGEPFFDSIESHLSSLLFSIPAVKSVAFGNDKISELFGSEANDCYYYQDALVKTTSNNNGGIMECQSFLQLESNRHLLFLKNKKRLM